MPFCPSQGECQEKRHSQKGHAKRGMLVSMHMVFLSPGFILHKGDACENSDPYFFHPSKKKKIQEILGGGAMAPTGPPFIVEI
jgi:hypothetical protein